MKVVNHGNGVISAAPDDDCDADAKAVSQASSQRVVAVRPTRKAGWQKPLFSSGPHIFFRDCD